MYRRNAAQTPRPADKTVNQSFGAMAAKAVLDFLVSSGLVDRAERENRRRDRHIKRAKKHTDFYGMGLNGPRAVARRRRQRLKIEARRAALSPAERRWAMTKLTDLAPHWIMPSNWTAGPFYIGVSFLCPHCDHTKCPTCGTQRGKRIAFSFWPPIDPENWLSRISDIPHDNFHRRVSGDTFDTLTIEPSIGLDPHWHGRLTAGVLHP